VETRTDRPGTHALALALALALDVHARYDQAQMTSEPCLRDPSGTPFTSNFERDAAVAFVGVLELRHRQPPAYRRAMARRIEP
jgi:hypothetical protein